MLIATSDSGRTRRFVLMRLITFILGAVAVAMKMMTVSGIYSPMVLWRVTGSLCPPLLLIGLLFLLNSTWRVGKILTCIFDSSMLSLVLKSHRQPVSLLERYYRFCSIVKFAAPVLFLCCGVAGSLSP